MRRDYEKLFSCLEQENFSEGLSEKIFFAIEKEKIRRETRMRIAIISFFVISIIAIPFSFGILARQAANSGFVYYIFTAFGNLSAFAAYRKDFLLAIAESAPLAAFAAFGVNIIALTAAAHNLNL